MKKATFTLLLLLTTNFIFAQHKYMQEENEALQVIKQERQNNQNKFIGDISGICDVVTTVTNQGAGIGWDDCDGQVYEGTAEFQASVGTSYNVFTISPGGQTLNDLSFGAYYPCYGTETQDGMPNSDIFAPTLFFDLSELGELSFSGASQWGEVYTMMEIEMDGASLNFNWTNDYGEGANVRLERQDGQIWEDLLTPCTFDSESDSLALIALYNATDGPNWNIPWDLNTTVHEWYGVNIDPVSCRVTGIDMGRSPELSALGFFGNNLTGELPDEIADLTELTVLDLGFNLLEGEVLPKLTGMTSLEFLSLNNNLFTGTIIPELANLVNLELFTISGNNMEGELPAELGTMPELRTFFSSSNNLTGEIPAEFGNFASLRSLSMWGNNFTGSLPSELGNIETLSNLTLDFNNLSGEIPASLGDIPSLIFLRLSFNQLSGEIPSGFPGTFIVRLNNNDLSGEVPLVFGTSDVMNEINLSNNNLSGQIPSRYISEFNFQELYFANNDFSGCLASLDNLCLHDHNPNLDTVLINGVEYYAQFATGYNFAGNPKLAWEGELQNICDGNDQIGAPCNDGDPDTTNDGIDANCECTQIVSTTEIEELNEITISPNPTYAGNPIFVTLDISENIKINMDVLDLQGKVIMNKSLDLNNGSNSITLESDGLSSGLYFLQLSTANGVTSHKFVVQ